MRFLIFLLLTHLPYVYLYSQKNKAFSVIMANVDKLNSEQLAKNRGSDIKNLTSTTLNRADIFDGIDIHANVDSLRRIEKLKNNDSLKTLIISSKFNCDDIPKQLTNENLNLGKLPILLAKIFECETSEHNQSYPKNKEAAVILINPLGNKKQTKIFYNIIPTGNKKRIEGSAKVIDFLINRELIQSGTDVNPILVSRLRSYKTGAYLKKAIELGINVIILCPKFVSTNEFSPKLVKKYLFANDLGQCLIGLQTIGKDVDVNPEKYFFPTQTDIRKVLGWF